MPRTAAFIVVMLLAGFAARGTTTDPEQVICPVCGKEITVFTIGSTNSFGGLDYDLCSHAVGTQPRTLLVWTCPHCWYSRIAGRFEDEVSGELAERVKEELRPPVPLPNVTDQRKIPAWVKYRLAAQVMEWRGTAALERANLYLEGAWSTRSDTCWPCEGLGTHQAAYSRMRRESAEGQPDLPTPDVFRAFVNCENDLRSAARQIELAAGEKDPATKALRSLMAAGLLRGRGENLQAAGILDGLTQDAGVPAEVATVARALRKGIDRERWFQGRWLEALEEWLESADSEKREMEDQKRASLFYIAGETCRRLDRKEEAAKWFRRAMEIEATPVIFKIARSALQKVGGDAGAQEAVDKSTKKMLGSLIERLNDPETARSARGEIQMLMDPALEPGVIGALGSEHPEVRSAAALALMELPEPSDAAVDALCRQLTDEEKDPRWRAAVALHRIGASRSRAAVERALVLESDSWVRMALAEVLGFVGTEASLPALFTSMSSESQLELSALRGALSKIGFLAVPDDLSSSAEIEAWWKKNRPGGRSDWLRAGFAARDVGALEPWDRADVPSLLDALTHEDPLVRCNAVRLLRKISGRRLPLWEIARDSNGKRIRQERAAAIAVWRRWWAENR